MYFTSFTIISSINIFQALKEKVQIYLVTLLCNLVVIKFYSVTFLSNLVDLNYYFLRYPFHFFFKIIEKPYGTPQINKLEAQWAEPVSFTFHSALRKLYIEPSIGASYQFSVHLATRFQRRFFLNKPPKNCLWWPFL
jgi:hypothetical protein